MMHELSDLCLAPCSLCYGWRSLPAVAEDQTAQAIARRGAEARRGVVAGTAP